MYLLVYILDLKDAKSACPFLTKMESTVKEASHADIIEMGVDSKNEAIQQEGVCLLCFSISIFITLFIFVKF